MFFRRKNRDLDDEISSHLSLSARDRIDRGASPDDARLGAQREFGSPALVMEVTREQWGWLRWERISQDLHYAFRQLRANPGFTATAILTLALGIGANSAIFSVVNAVVLSPLPYRDAARLYTGSGRTPKGYRDAAVNPADFRDFRDQNHTFDLLAASFVAGASPSNWSYNGQARQIKGAMVTAGFFEVLGYASEAGRNFTRADEQVYDPQVVILSHHLWQSLYGGNPAIIGSGGRLDSNPVTIVGVMPASLDYPRDADLWYIAPMQAGGMQQRRGHFLRVTGRLAPGVTRTAAQADLDGIAERLGRLYPVTNEGWGMYIRPMQEAIVGNNTPSVLLMLLGAAGLVLLIACVNIANLLLARYGARQREMSIRAAIGAGRSRILGQLVVENMLLAVIAGGLAVALAYGGVELLRSFGPAAVPRLSEVRLDARVLAFTALVSIATALVFGLAPAWLATSSAQISGLREDSRTGGSRRRHRFGAALVAGEAALSICLLIGAALLVQSLIRTLRTSPGFRSDHVLSTRMMLPQTRDEVRNIHIVDRLIAAARALPGVQAAGAASEMPIHHEYNDTFFQIVEHPPAKPGDVHDEDFRRVTAGYFDVMRIPLLRGRLIGDHDTNKSPCVVVVDEPFVRRYFPNEDAVGKHIKFGDACEIVGVVGPVRHHNLQTAARPTMYLPFAQMPSGAVHLLVRSEAGAAAMSAPLQRLAPGADADIAPSAVESMDAFLAQSVSGDRFQTMLLALFAALALVLAMAGVYGVFSYIVSQQTHEIGVRMALGARPGQMLGLILGRGALLAGMGAAIGLGGAWFAMQLLAKQLYEIQPRDPATFAAAAGVLVAVALAACAAPARRAMKVDPVIALRYE